MADWSSYGLSDFLPFSFETYQQLGALYNARFGNAVFVGLGAGLMLLVLMLRPVRWRLRLALVVLGLSWLWISWAYQLQTLAPLLWAGELFAIAFALQSGLLLASAALPTPALVLPRRPERRRPGDWLAAGMLAFSVLLLPLIELAVGVPWSGLSIFGTAAIPTAIGTLGLAALVGPRLALLLMPIPMLWCLIASLILLGLGDPLWALPALAVPVAAAAALLDGRNHASSASVSR
jgi:hypothetical protein